MMCLHIRKLISILLIITLFVSLVSIASYAVTGTVNGTDGSLNMRTGPGTSYGLVRAIPNGTKVEILATSGNWYKVSCTVGGNSYTGYMSANYIITDNGGSSYAVNVPSIYSTYINQVKAEHPNWQFKFLYTGIEWSDLVTAQVQKGMNVVTSATNPISFRSTSVNFSGNTSSYTYTLIERPSWYQAHGQVIQHYLDPRNFITDTSVFQFEQLAYDSSVHTLSGVQAILKGTFMDNKKITTTEGTQLTYAEVFMKAAQTYNVSPYHLAARVVQEVGTQGSSTTKGPIYNFYNIGANTGAADGLRWAQNGTTYWRPWDTPYKSIMGGAQYISAGYISAGQSTLYTQKFDIIARGGYFNHQYMSNVQAPYTESKNVYKAYMKMGILESNFVFVIPVYNNMPSQVCALPERSNIPNMAKDTDGLYYATRIYPDVTDQAWYYEAVKYCKENKIFTGYSNGNFGPNDKILRQDFAILMARIAGGNLPKYQSAAGTFPDVKSGAYYTPSVLWANDFGVLSGYQNGKFGTGDPITREQICTMLYNYAKSTFNDMSLSRTESAILTKYSDARQISSFARTAIAWCIDIGVISGKDAYHLAPTATATRAEIASIMQRAVESGMKYEGYADVLTGSKYYDAIQYCTHKHFFSGNEDGKFLPGISIQRQDFVVVLSNAANVDVAAYANKDGGFSDVAVNSYYSSAISWAAENKIVSGYQDGRFGVGDSLTRQSICVILYRYTQNQGKSVRINDAIDDIISTYPDADSIDFEAQTAAAWCIENNIVQGNAEGNFGPKEPVSRGEIAYMLMRMCEMNIF